MPFRQIGDLHADGQHETVRMNNFRGENDVETEAAKKEMQAIDTMPLRRL